MLRNYCLFVSLLAGMSLTFFSLQQAVHTPGIGFSSLSTPPISSPLSTSSATSSHETFDGTDLGIAFQYPTNWVEFKGGFDQGVLTDFEGVVSFDILNDPLNQTNGASSEGSGLVHPNLSIVALNSPYHFLSLGQYAQFRTSDIRQLFSDYNLQITANSQSNETIDGYPYWVLNYSFTIDNMAQRYGMIIMLIRGEMVYEITYIADSYEDYVRNLPEIGEMIKTAYFVDFSNRR
jgi:hypothetical protein